MQFFIIFASLFVSTSGFILQSSDTKAAQVTGPVKCNDITFLWCADKLLKDLTIPANKNSTVFLANVLEKQLRIGKEFMLQEMASFSAFSYCLGNQADDCLSQQHLIDIGLDSLDAAGYASYAVAIRNAATETFSQFNENFPCFFSVYNTTQFQKKDVPQCTESFEAAVKIDPDNLCPLGHAFIQCLADPMQKCGKDFVNAVCNNTLTTFLVNAPQCKGQIKCDF